MTPDPARGGYAPARGQGVPTPPPAPLMTGGKGAGGRQMSALEAAFAAPMPVRSSEGSRSRARSDHGQVGGPVATKARTLPPPGVVLTPAREVAFLRDFGNPPGETWEEVARQSRHNSVHCGSCHRLSPIGSLRCGFCDFKFSTVRGRSRRAPETAGHGLDREMQRSPSRVPEPKRGHHRSSSGDDRKRLRRLQVHIQRWDSDQEYRMNSSRKGMVRDQYNTGVVRPWLAINATDEPPHQPADIVTA